QVARQKAGHERSVTNPVRRRLIVRERLPGGGCVAKAMDGDTADLPGWLGSIGRSEDLYLDFAISQAGDHLHHPGGDHVFRMSRKRGDDIKYLHLSASGAASSFLRSRTRNNTGQS